MSLNYGIEGKAKFIKKNLENTKRIKKQQKKPSSCYIPSRLELWFSSRMIDFLYNEESDDWLS